MEAVPRVKADRMGIPKPRYIGDIYRVTGYPAGEMVSYGVAYRMTDPGNPGRWCWWIEMDDGDFYPWAWDRPFAAMLYEKVELVRRNPLPEEGEKDQLRETLERVLGHLGELRDAWTNGVISEHDGHGWMRSSRNAELEVEVRALLEGYGNKA